MEHPFWKSQFRIGDPEDLRRLRESSIRQVWIDTSKGLDVEQGSSVADIAAEVDDLLAEADEAPGTAGATTLAEEMQRASTIFATSSAAVSSMFQEARMGRALDAHGALALVEEIANSVARNPEALISLARLKTKNDYTYMHSVAVCAMMVALAHQLGLDEDETRKAGLAGLLHDIGKMVIPDEILDKPGRLTDSEFDFIKRHPVEGHRLLRESQDVDEVALDVCLHHHEKMDGSGYPDNLAGASISLFARMGAVCDVYDAITSNRPYKDGWDPAESLRKMAEWSQGHFDPQIFQHFVKSIGIYPIGSLVRLESGRLGVVVQQAQASLLTPLVKVFYSTRRAQRIRPEVVNLSVAGIQDKIVSREEPGNWNFPDLNELWGAVFPAGQMT
jgi:putative nucleotidyltransferase with HDIG domain